MLKLKLQYFGHLMWPTESFEKDPDAGKDWGQEEKGLTRGQDGWMALLIQWTWVWTSSRNWWWKGKPGVLHSKGSQRVRHNGATELNWLFDTVGASLITKTVKNLPAMREARVRSPGWKDFLKKEMATHSSILALEIRWMEEAGSSWGSKKKSDMTLNNSNQIPLPLILIFTIWIEGRNTKVQPQRTEIITKYITKGCCCCCCCCC